MRFVMFYHSLLSDWNHGNAHFLRGVATELLAQGHEVDIYEPTDAWSMQNLLAEHGETPIQLFKKAYPALKSTRYHLDQLDLNSVLAGADVVIVHEWNQHRLVHNIGQHRRDQGNYVLLFHDTHHRMVTAPESMAAYDLAHYDGVLAYGQILRNLYERSGRVQRAWTWHEAADLRVFHPRPATEPQGDLVWVGNWGDDERTAELHEFLIEPCKALGLKARVYGVRYPEHAKAALASAAIEYGGWLPNFEAPTVFSKFKVTVHVPRRPYVRALPGIPTIRPFEALACGIPLVCSPWEDAENLFAPGRDYLVAKDGQEMTTHIKHILEDRLFAKDLANHGMTTLRSRHTCAHRVQQLLNIVREARSQILPRTAPRARSVPAVLT